jgi:hypothetical protein
MTKHDEKYYQAIRDGVRDAILAYADEHPISFPTAIENGVKAAVEEHMAARASTGRKQSACDRAKDLLRGILADDRKRSPSTTSKILPRIMTSRGQPYDERPANWQSRPLRNAARGTANGFGTSLHANSPADSSGAQARF